MMEEHHGLADKPQLLPVTLGLLKVKEQIPNHLQQAVPVEVVVDIHVKRIRVTQGTEDGSGAELLIPPRVKV